uniref:Transmembrane protein n=1 Tax=Streptomyces sp. NBC_00008 TaxID=2903610 RepID=A0AAU2VRF9_9ACTN
MHMNSAPHLLTEDRPEYERILDDALRHAHERPDLAAVGERLNPVQLRTMAMAATALITATAATEYEHYVKAREELRAATADAGQDAAGLIGADGPDGSGAGLGAVVTVLAPVLAGTAAVIFLLVGYILKMLSPPPSFAGTMVSVGWVFVALTAAAILIAAAGLLITALRNGSTSLAADDPGEELPEDVARAREAWRHALLERGILPFLRDALADPGAAPAARTPYPSANRIPKIGYSRPDFSSPGDGPAAAPRPTFTSPDFTSPDFGGPEHEMD